MTHRVETHRTRGPNQPPLTLQFSAEEVLFGNSHVPTHRVCKRSGQHRRWVAGVDARNRMFGMQTHGRASCQQQWEDFLVFTIALDLKSLSRTITRVGTYGATFSFLPDNLPDGNGKFVVAEDGRKLCEPPLLSKRGRIPR